MRNTAARAKAPPEVALTLGYDLEEPGLLAGATGLVTSNDIVRDPKFPMRTLARDLPRLRLAMVRQRITLPPCLACIDHPTYDTMTLWRYFTLEERPFVSLDQCLELAGLASHKSVISGQDVGRLIDSQQWRTIAAYAIADVLAQDMLYLVMTGQIAAPDPPPEAATLQPAASAGAAQSQPVEPHVVDDTATTDQEQEAIGRSIAALLIKYGITTTTKTAESQA